MDALLDAREPVLQNQFHFRITSAEPVTFTSVATSCDCVSASLSRKTYRPGETGEVTVVFNSDRHEGHRVVLVTLQITATSREAPKVLRLNVTVFQNAGAAPTLLEWTSGEGLSEKQAVVAVGSERGETTVTLLPYDETAVRVALRPSERNGRYSLSVTPRATDRPRNTRIRLQCMRAGQPLETLLIYARVR